MIFSICDMLACLLIGCNKLERLIMLIAEVEWTDHLVPVLGERQFICTYMHKISCTDLPQMFVPKWAESGANIHGPELVELVQASCTRRFPI